MKNIKKNALKVVVLIALCAPAAFADDDGDMPGGGRLSNGDGTTGGEVVISQTSDNGATGSGQTTGTSEVDALLNSIYEFLGLMM